MRDHYAIRCPDQVEALERTLQELVKNQKRQKLCLPTSIRDPLHPPAGGMTLWSLNRIGDSNLNIYTVTHVFFAKFFLCIGIVIYNTKDLN